MEANPVPKKKLFICKFCKKKYPCGKSLGGHIRIHLNGNLSNVNVNSTYVEEEAIKNIAAASGSNSKKDSDPEAGGPYGGYGLRENPKKTRRFTVDSTNTNLLQEMVCKECGKGFQSLKALCGHMASHSKNSFEDHSGTTEKLKDQVFDSQSDTETSSAPGMRRRSARMRYKAIDVYSSSLSLPNGSLSSASDDIEQEQEEVAMCLMMLSKDSGFKGCFSSIADFSDNNSVVVETKSSSPKLRISVKNGINRVYNANGFLEMKKPKQQQVMPIENDNSENSENSDSGYFRNGPKKVESEISVHGFTRNDEFKKPNLEFGCRFEKEFNPELGKRLSRFRRIKTKLGKNLIEQDGEYGESDSVSRKKGKKDDSYNPEFPSTKASKTGKCPPIGAQRSSSHRRTNVCSESIYDSGANSIGTDSVPNRKAIRSCNGKNPIEQNGEKKLGLKKGKVHECPFCFKVFRSGQALGGHKRSHFVGGTEDRTVVINQQVPEVSMSGLIDLNLPAPVEDDTNGYYLSSW